MSALVGYEDGPPMNSGQMYPDAVAGITACGAILAAVHHRNRTGEGQYIDLSMQEANLAFVGDAALEFTLTGKQRPRMGNRHHTFAPHGIYPVAGEDRWIAIACETEAQWEALARAAALGWEGDARFATAERRKANETALDEALAGWTREQERDELAAKLLEAGVIAAPVLDGREVASDAALRERGTVVEVAHREAGTWPQAVSPLHFSRTPATRRAACTAAGRAHAGSVERTARHDRGRIRGAGRGWRFREGAAAMTSYRQIRYEQEGRVARLVLNRPKYRNAQSRILIEELDDAYARAGKDESVGAIVLMGEGDHFSAGHDLGTPDELADREERPIGEGLRSRYRRSWDMNIDPTLRWRNIPKPTIAAVHGYCIFAGWIIASASDVVFAAEDAMFLPTNFQYFSVPWDLHVRKAKEILFESRFIDAHEAEELGFREPRGGRASGWTKKRWPMPRGWRRTTLSSSA